MFAGGEPPWINGADKQGLSKQEKPVRAPLSGSMEVTLLLPVIYEGQKRLKRVLGWQGEL